MVLVIHYSDVIIDAIARSECLPGGGKNYSYATGRNLRWQRASASLLLLQ